MGLGLHGGGAGTARFFARLGARVIVTDLKTKKELVASFEKLRSFRNIIYHLGKHYISDFKTADFVIKNPGVPDDSEFLKIAKRSGAPILSDVEIFFLASPAPIIGVTGTKGKSTATWLIGEFLQKSGRKVWIGGNIRTSVLELLPKVRKGHLVVLELSSFQLDSLARSGLSPAIAVITNIFPDHLNRYSSVRSYQKSKAAIFKYQSAGGHLFINARDALLKRMARNAPSKVHAFDPVRIMRRFSSSIRPEIPPYHLTNIAAAICVVKHLGAGDAAIRKVLRKFTGIPGRMEPIRKVRGIEFINDTTATNPGAAEAAVIATKQRIGKKFLHVIAGGYDKGLPIGDFVRAIARYAASAIFLPGTATERMKSEMKKNKPAAKVSDAKSMQEAVRIAYNTAKRGDVALLSPGAASFGLFQHEFDRGDQFIKAVKKLK